LFADDEIAPLTRAIDEPALEPAKIVTLEELRDPVYSARRSLLLDEELASSGGRRRAPPIRLAGACLALALTVAVVAAAVFGILEPGSVPPINHGATTAAVGLLVPGRAMVASIRAMGHKIAALGRSLSTEVTRVDHRQRTQRQQHHRGRRPTAIHGASGSVAAGLPARSSEPAAPSYTVGSSSDTPAAAGTSTPSSSSNGSAATGSGNRPVQVSTTSSSPSHSASSSTSKVTTTAQSRPATAECVGLNQIGCQAGRSTRP
jgi:hypothetical protein